MYYLVLIVSLVANGPSLQVEHIPFNDKSSCQEALIEILNEYDRNPISGVAESRVSDMHIDGWCVAKDED
jgi:hypothetical protein